MLPFKCFCLNWWFRSRMSHRRNVRSRYVSSLHMHECSQTNSVVCEAESPQNAKPFLNPFLTVCVKRCPSSVFTCFYVLFSPQLLAKLDYDLFGNLRTALFHRLAGQCIHKEYAVVPYDLYCVGVV